LYDLYKTLKAARTKRGVMDFDRIETQVLFDDNGKIANIVATSRNDSNTLAKCLDSGCTPPSKLKPTALKNLRVS
jgi:exoribonuclease R